MVVQVLDLDLENLGSYPCSAMKFPGRPYAYYYLSALPTSGEEEPPPWAPQMKGGIKNVHNK